MLKLITIFKQFYKKKRQKECKPVLKCDNKHESLHSAAGICTEKKKYLIIPAVLNITSCI